MTPPEAAAFLAAVAAFDNRNITEANAHAWASALHDVTLADAMEYLPQFFRTATRESKNWLMPGDVLAGVTEIQYERIYARASEAVDGWPEVEIGDEGWRENNQARTVAWGKARDEAAEENPLGGADILRRAQERKRKELENAGGVSW